jgi:hypothetical protein
MREWKREREREEEEKTDRLEDMAILI